MFIVSNTRDFECNSIEEFINKLRICFENKNENEIWCSVHEDEGNFT